MLQQINSANIESQIHHRSVSIRTINIHTETTYFTYPMLDRMHQKPVWTSSPLIYRIEQLDETKRKGKLLVKFSFQKKNVRKYRRRNGQKPPSRNSSLEKKSNRIFRVKWREGKGRKFSHHWLSRYDRDAISIGREKGRKREEKGGGISVCNLSHLDPVNCNPSSARSWWIKRLFYRWFHEAKFRCATNRESFGFVRVKSINGRRG